METATPATSLPRKELRSTNTYRAAVVVAPQRVEIHEVVIPRAKPGQVRVRITHCGVCASNIPAWQGRPWFKYPLSSGALGHEALGVIDDVGIGVTGWEEGDRVAYIGERGYAECETVNAEALFRLPEDTGETLFLAEPLACAMNVFRRAGIRRGDTVAILGVGFLGALLTQLVINVGARVIAVGRRDSSVTPATIFGAESIVSVDSSAIIEGIDSKTAGRMCDVVIEATGHQEPLDLAAHLTRVRGRMVIAGYHQDGLRQVNMQMWNWRGLDVINAHERDPLVYLDGMDLAKRSVAEGRLTTNRLITHRFPLDELGTALSLAAERPAGFIKAVIEL
jgi:NADPH:quinone reductase